MVGRTTGALLGVVILLGVAWLLAGLPASESSTNLYTSGVAGLVAVIAALTLKHKLHWPLNFEVCTLGGISIQYLIAPVVSRWLTSVEALAEMVVTEERWAVRSGQVGGMAIVLAYAAFFMLGVLILEQFHPPATRPPEKTESRSNFGKGDFLFCCLFAPLSWLSRSILLARGAYYSLNRTDFQFTSSLYSALAQIDSLLSAALTAYAVRCFMLKPSWRWSAILYLIAEFGWNTFSGSRQRALVVLIVAVLTFILVRQRIPWKTIAVGCVGATLFIGAMDYYRYALRQTTVATQFDLGGIQDAWSLAAEKASEESRGDLALRGVTRLSDLDSIAAIYLWVPSLVPFESGETYWRVPAALVPRVLWPKKPTTTMPINAWLFQDEGGSSPLTIMGEGYLNFGWYGVAFAGMLCGVLLSLVQRSFHRALYSQVYVPLYAAALFGVARLHTEPLAIYVAWSIKTTILLILAVQFVGPGWFMRRRSALHTSHNQTATTTPNASVGLNKPTRREIVTRRFARQSQRGRKTRLAGC